MSVIAAFNDQFLSEENQQYFEDIHQRESMEMLDNMGYLDIPNTTVFEVSEAAYQKGISQFRNDCMQSQSGFEILQAKQLIAADTPKPLTEWELAFLRDLTDIEGEGAALIKSYDEVASNKLKIRVLNWRLSLLGLINETPSDTLPHQIDQLLTQVQEWSGATSNVEAFILLGDVALLTKKICTQIKNGNQTIKPFAFFEMRPKTIRQSGTGFSPDAERFNSRLVFTPNGQQYLDGLSKSDLKDQIATPLNQFLLRLTQVNLWNTGTYQGRLDNDMGPMSLEGLTSYIKFIDETYHTRGGYTNTDMINKIKGNYWCFNFYYFFGILYPVLDQYHQDHQNKQENQSLAQQFSDFIDNIPDEEGKESLLAEMTSQIKTGLNTAAENKQKTKNKAGKQLQKSMSVFFTNIKEKINDGLSTVLGKIKDLFQQIKNGGLILIREIKEVFSKVKDALEFFFSDRKIKTTIPDNPNQFLQTDFDGQFDALVTIGTGKIEGSLLTQHLDQQKELSTTLTQVSNTVGAIMSIAVNIAKGPYGWVKLGIQLVKILSSTLAI